MSFPNPSERRTSVTMAWAAVFVIAVMFIVAAFVA
jgi:hypothetical protein